MAAGELESILSEELRRDIKTLQELPDIVASNMEAIIAFNRAGRDSEGTAQYVKTIKELKEQLKEQEKANRDLIKSQNDFIKSVEASEKIKQTELKTDRERLKNQEQDIKNKRQQAAYERELQREIDKKNKAIEKEMEKQKQLSSAYNVLKKEYTDTADAAKELGAKIVLLQREMGDSPTKAQAAEMAHLRDAYASTQKAAYNMHTQLVMIEKSVGQSQRNVGNYTNNVFALTQVLREAPAFANSFQTGLMAISNNLPMLGDEFKKVKAEVGSTGGAIKIFASSLFSVSNIFTLAFAAITIGISLLSRYKDKTKEAAKATSDLDNATKDAAASIGKEVIELRKLVDVSTNTNLSYKERGAAVDELQKKFPEYFGNLSREKILNGDIKGVYDQLTNSIVARAKATAQYNLLAVKQQELIEAQIKLDAITNNADPNTFIYDSDGQAQQLRAVIANREREVKAIENTIIATQQLGAANAYWLDQNQRKAFEAQQQKERDMALLTEDERKELDKRNKANEKAAEKDAETWAKRMERFKQTLKEMAAYFRSGDFKNDIKNAIDSISANDRGGLTLELEVRMKRGEKRLASDLKDVDTELNAQLVKIHDKFNRGRYKSHEDYEKDITRVTTEYALKRLNIEIANSERMLALLPPETEEYKKFYARLLQLKKEHSAGLAAMTESDYEKSKRHRDTILGNTAEAMNASGQLNAEIAAFGDLYFQKRIAQLEREGDLIDKNLERELFKIKYSGLSEEEQRKKSLAAERVADAERKRRDADILKEKRRQAAFNRVVNIGEIIAKTALAVITAMAEGDWYTKTFRAFAAGAIGSAQLVRVLATPLPQYKHGTRNHPGGPFVAGEAGEAELVIPNGANPYIAPAGARIYNEGPGTRVIPEHDLIAAGLGMLTPGLLRSVQRNPQQINNLDISDRSARRIGKYVSVQVFANSYGQDTWRIKHCKGGRNG